MDNNPVTPAAGSPVVPPVNLVTPTPQAPIPPKVEGSSKKMIIFLIIGLVVIVLVVGLIYFFLSMQQTSSQPSQTNNTNPHASIAQLKDALDQELDSINVSASEGDFKSVDQDLQSL